MQNYHAPGGTWPFTAGAAYSAGDPVLLGTTGNGVVGIVCNDVANGGAGQAQVEGVFLVSKDTGQTWTQGERIYFDGTNFNTTATGTTFAGFAYAAAGSADTTGYLKLAAASA